jgi:hypothetical protein
MTDEGAPLQPGTEEITVPFHPRSTYAGYEAFGGGDGAVLVEPRAARELRSAAEFATQERRVTGGLLFGRGWVDAQGAYLVIDGFLEAGPGENSGDRLIAGGADEFTLSEADLRLLRQDAARMYSADLELGWWRTLAAPGEFGHQDLATQAELVGPDGVGLLVYGSGPYWGTAYLGPDGRAPDTAGTLVTAAGAVPEPPDPDLAPDPGAALHPGPEVVDLAGGESLLEEPAPAQEPPSADVPPGRRGPRRSRQPREPRQPRRRVSSRVRVPRRAPALGAKPANAGYQGPETPADVQFVIIALAVAIVAAAIIVGALVHSVIVAVIIAAVGLLAVFSTVWMSRR